MKHLRGAGGVATDLGDLVEARAQAIQELFVEATACGRQRVIDPLTVFSGCHQPDAPQIGQMPRSRGLGHVNHLEEVVDAELALTEQVQNAQAGAVGKRAEYGIDSSIPLRPPGHW